MSPLELELRTLPAEVLPLFERLSVPPRLSAHLRLVHDVAGELLALVQREWPQPVREREVAFGAATHDLGKILVREELSGPGHRHEESGRLLLLREGFPPELARFARTHAEWRSEGLPLEDLLVALADKVWKGSREALLEEKVARQLATGGRDFWAVHATLNEHLDRLAEAAPERLAWQGQHPLG